MITYETLRKIQRAEEKKNLSQLPRSFPEEVKQYLSSLKSEDLEHKNASNVLQQIYDGRLLKIIKLAVSEADGVKVNRSVLLPQERHILDSIVGSISEYRKQLELAPKQKVKKDKDAMKVKFLEDFPAFVGVDGKEYGPYTAGETGEVPPENAEFVTGRKKAVEV